LSAHIVLQQYGKWEIQRLVPLLWNPVWTEIMIQVQPSLNWNNDSSPSAVRTRASHTMSRQPYGWKMLFKYNRPINKSYPCNRPWRPIGLRRRGSHIFYRQSAHRWRWGCQPYSCPLSPGRFLVIISVRGWINPRARVRLEELGQLKNSMTSSRLEHETFRLVSQCVNQLRYRYQYRKYVKNRI
jgi:hypothetical protein